MAGGRRRGRRGSVPDRREWSWCRTIRRTSRPWQCRDGWRCNGVFRVAGLTRQTHLHNYCKTVQGALTLPNLPFRRGPWFRRGGSGETQGSSLRPTVPVSAVLQDSRSVPRRDGRSRTGFRGLGSEVRVSVGGSGAPLVRGVVSRGPVSRVRQRASTGAPGPPRRPLVPPSTTPALSLRPCGGPGGEGVCLVLSSPGTRLLCSEGGRRSFFS